jgi:hypothetical protein
MNVRSFVTLPAPGATVPAGRAVEVAGIGFDGGSGIRAVEISCDGGSTWAAAALDNDLGRYSFRRWRYRWSPAARGDYPAPVPGNGRRPPGPAGYGGVESQRLYAKRRRGDDRPCRVSRPTGRRHPATTPLTDRDSA